MKPPTPTKKAQAALEFLMTYGWALIAVLAAIGAFTYLGILNTDKLIPEQCTITTGFECGDFVLREFDFTTDESEVEIELINSFGKSIIIYQANVTYEADIGNTACGRWHTIPNQVGGAQLSMTLKPGERAYMGCNEGSGATIKMNANELATVNFWFDYIFVGGKYNKTAEGKIVGRVKEI